MSSRKLYILIIVILALLVITSASLAFLQKYTMTMQSSVLSSASSQSVEEHNFIIMGDSGVNSEAQKRIAKLIDTENFEAVIHTGDLIYNAGEASEYKSKFEDIYSDKIKNNFLPSLGNHDIGTENGRPYLDRFDLPQQALNSVDNERYYYKDFGKVRFISLDSTTALDDVSEAKTDDMADWLNIVLQKSSDKLVIIFFHYPPFSGGSKHESNESVRTKLIPIFDKYSNIRLVLTGHNHSFHLTCKLAYSKESGRACLDENSVGIYYLTTGGAGAPLYLFEDKISDYTKYRSVVYHYVKLKIRDNDISIEVVDDFGNVIYKTSLK